MSKETNQILTHQVVHELMLAAFNRLNDGDRTHVVTNIYATRYSADSYALLVGVDEYGPFGFRDGIEWGTTVILNRIANVPQAVQP